MAGSIIAGSNNFHDLYSALENATKTGDRLRVQDKQGVLVWSTQSKHLRRFINVLSFSGYGRHQDKKVAQSLALALDRHASHLNTTAPNHAEAQNQLQTFKTELTSFSDQGLVTGNFFHKLASKLAGTHKGNAALNWVKQHDVTDLIPSSSKLPYQSERTPSDRVESLKNYARPRVLEALTAGGIANSTQREAAEVVIDRLAARVLTYLEQRDQTHSPADQAKLTSSVIANEIKHHLDKDYGADLAQVAWTVGAELGVFLGEVEADIPGKQPHAIHLSVPVSSQEETPSNGQVTVATTTRHEESRVDHPVNSSLASSTLPRPQSAESHVSGIPVSSVTPLAAGVRGVSHTPEGVHKPSGAKIDYFADQADTKVLKRLTAFEINRGRLAQVIADPNWIEQETGALFSEKQLVNGKKAQKRLERHTAFAQLSDKKQHAIFEKLEKRVHEAQLANPDVKLDSDWFANQLRISTERVLDKRFVGVSKGVKTYHPPKHQSIKHQAKEKAALHVQGARTTININKTLQERSTVTRVLEGVDNIVEQLQGQASSAIGFSSTPQRSKIDSWIARADFRPLREIELDAFEKQFTRRAGAFAEVNQHWLRDEDWQNLAIDTIRDLRQRQQW